METIFSYLKLKQVGLVAGGLGIRHGQEEAV